MRLSGKTRTLRGTIDIPEQTDAAVPNSAKILLVLDDGRINVGYKIVEFRVWPSDMIGNTSTGRSTEVQAHLALSLEPVAAALPRASDNREIAWASYNAGAGYRTTFFSLVDPDHIVVRDLQILLPQVFNFGYASSINYYVRMEEYEITDTEAIISIIKEESQDVDN